MQTVLVAGGAGFIGLHLCKSLLDTNYKVICVDNFLTSDKNNLRDLLKNPEFKLIEFDVVKPISDSTLRLGSGQKLDYIFHLASPASPNKKSPKSYINYPIETLLVNSLGSYNLLELARQFNAKFLYASSSEIVFEDLPIDDPKARKPDITKAKRILGWEPKVTTEKGLQKTIEYFRSI